MGMKDPLPTFTTFVERIRDAHPDFAYIHVIEDRAHDTSDALRKVWGDRPYIAAGGFDRTSAISTVEKQGGLIAFGRHFIANVSAFFIIRQLDINLTIILYVARSSLAPEGRH
jgi:NADPH2 dehydrogenase